MLRLLPMYRRAVVVARVPRAAPKRGAQFRALKLTAKSNGTRLNHAISHLARDSTAKSVGAGYVDAPASSRVCHCSSNSGTDTGPMQRAMRATPREALRHVSFSWITAVIHEVGIRVAQPLPRQPTPITRSDRVKGYRGRGVSDAASRSVPFVGADR
jgi:hypothetical protein